MNYSNIRNLIVANLPIAVLALSSAALKSQPQQQQAQPPSHELKVGARNSTVRNIGSLQADSALIFPKRKAENDTLKSVALRRKGAFFYDSVTHIVWFFDGSKFRKITDSAITIYTKNDSIREHRVVTIRNKEKEKDVSLAFKQGRVEIDTLLVRKRRLGLSTDTFMVIHNDTVRKIPRDSLWNIYTKDDSIRNTQKTEGKRTVYLQSKKLIFELGQKNGSGTNSKDTGKIGIGQKNPLYTLDIATPSFLSNGSANSGGSTNGGANLDPKYDSVAVRISHKVLENKTSYGLLLSQRSNKESGRSAIGFEGGNAHTDSLMVARLWAQQGSKLQQSKFGIDVADSAKNLHTRMVIDSNGRIGIGTEKPSSLVHIVGRGSWKQYPKIQGNNSVSLTVDIDDSGRNNYIRVQAGANITSNGNNTSSTNASNTNSAPDRYSGIWLTERNSSWGFKIRNSATRDQLDFIATGSNQMMENQGVTIMRLKASSTNKRGESGSNTGSDRNFFGSVCINPNEGDQAKWITALSIKGDGSARSWNTTSDSALKTRVHNLVNTKTAILALRPVSYYFKGDLRDSARQKPPLQYGFIAQEVARSPLGSLVSDDNPEFSQITEANGQVRSIKTLNYSGIIAPLVAFTQELYRDKQQLAQQVAELQAQVKQIPELKRQVNALIQLINSGQAPLMAK